MSAFMYRPMYKTSKNTRKNVRKYRGAGSPSQTVKRLRLSIVEPNIKKRKDTTIVIQLRPLMDEDVLRQIFETIFPMEEGYSVEIDGNFINIYLTEVDAETSKIRCLELVLQELDDNKVIYVLHLNNCEVPSRPPQLGKGNVLLKKLVSNIRKYEEFQTVDVIIDIDASEIVIGNTKLSLAILQILCYGESWYNKLGFKEIGYEKNVIAMQLYINEKIKFLPKDPVKQGILKRLGYRHNMMKMEFFQKMNQRIKEISSNFRMDDESIKSELEYYNELLTAEKRKIRKIFSESGTDKFSNLKYDFSNGSV